MIRTVISCDRCGSQIVWRGVVAKKYLEIRAREEGWAAGKQHLCAKCKPEKKVKKK